MRYKKNSNFKRRNIVHSIPIGCILALLLLGNICVNPLGLGFGDDGDEAYAEEGISGLADTGISLTISGNLNETINADTKNTAYRAHTVKATASSIDSYSLSISYTDGSTSLKNSDANVSIGDVASSGVSGNSMQANTWGWGWSDSTSTNNSDITYRPMSTSQSIIKSDNSPVNNTANIEGKLAFAAKFPEGSAVGHYTANVLVSFAIEPRVVATIPFNGIMTMQEMTSSVCSGVNIGTTGKLEDTRDKKIYWIARLKDGNCWMTQNLDFDGGGTKLSTNYWDSVEVAQYYDPGEKYCYGTACNDTASHNDGHDAAGNLYNWYAATYGSGTSTTPDGTNAARSVCPDGWQLPTGGDTTSNKSFGYLVNGLSMATIVATPYYFTTDNNTGNYWSSTAAAISGAKYAHNFRFYSDKLYPTNETYRRSPAQVRCVAK